jgi:trigger factor
MQTSLETLGQLERRLTMSVPVAKIESEINQRLARLAKDAKLPGFRPGKVPMRMIAQQVRPKVRSDVISDRVQARFADALREQNLRIAGIPASSPNRAPASDELEFSAVFEVYPEVKVGDLTDVTIERPIAGGRRRGSHEHRSRCCAASARTITGSSARRLPATA